MSTNLLSIRTTRNLVSCCGSYSQVYFDIFIGPSCRSPISQDKIFSRQAFEPTDAELPGDDLAGIKPEGLDDEDMPKIIEDTAKGKGKARKRSARRIVDSEDDTEGELDSDMEDFIVQSDEDESEKDARRTERKRLGKKKAVVIDSEDEVESGGEDNEVIYGKKATPPISQEEIKMLPRFLPSTKMKVIFRFACHVVSIVDSYLLANDGESDHLGERESRRKGGIVYIR